MSDEDVPVRVRLRAPSHIWPLGFFARRFFLPLIKKSRGPPRDGKRAKVRLRGGLSTLLRSLNAKNPQPNWAAGGAEEGLRKDGERYKVDWATRTLKEFLKKNNLRVIRFHDLRHTCATMRRHTGVPMEDIQKFLGHSTITTTEGIYAHFDDTQHRTTISKLSDYLSDKTKDDGMGNVLSNQKEMQK